jgi:hypothetical protein
MMRINDSPETAILVNSEPPLTLDDYNRLEQTVSKEYIHYLIGLACILARSKGFRTDNLNKTLTWARIAQNSGYAKNSLKRLACFASAITRLQADLPSLAAEILIGKTRFSLNSTILLAKLSTSDISVIMKRAGTEDTPIRRIIAEQTKRPAANPKKYSNGHNIKRVFTSVKDTPRYDPDAQVSGLTYTIPSWVRAINRVYLSDMFEVSGNACAKLNIELENLKIFTTALIELITEAST